MNDINIRLKTLRNEMGISQKEMGEIIGIKSSGVSAIESGNRNVTEKHLQMIKNSGYGINIEWLRTGIGYKFLKSLNDKEIELMTSNLLSNQEEPMNKLILNIMKTYSKLDYKTKKAFDIFVNDLIDNLKKEG